MLFPGLLSLPSATQDHLSRGSATHSELGSSSRFLFLDDTHLCQGDRHHTHTHEHKHCDTNKLGDLGGQREPRVWVGGTVVGGALAVGSLSTELSFPAFRKRV